MNALAPIGHNGGPIDALEAVQSKHDDLFAEVANWLDGGKVEAEDQMRAVDALLAGVKDAEKEAKDAKENEYRPHKAAGDAVIARWKPFLDDLTRQKNGLTAAVDQFKRKLAAEKEAARRKAEAEAWEATRAARDAAAAANAADLEAQRAAAEAQRQAEEAQARAKAAEKDTVKGLRAVTEHVVVDGTGFARWLWQNDRPALEAFMGEYARRNKINLPGIVEARTERRAF